MFHVYFLDHVARPEGLRLAQLRELLNVRYGKPTWGMKAHTPSLRFVSTIVFFATFSPFSSRLCPPAYHPSLP